MSRRRSASEAAIPHYRAQLRTPRFLGTRHMQDRARHGRAESIRAGAPLSRSDERGHYIDLLPGFATVLKAEAYFCSCTSLSTPRHPHTSRVVLPNGRFLCKHSSVDNRDPPRLASPPNIFHQHPIRSIIIPHISNSSQSKPAVAYQARHVALARRHATATRAHPLSHGLCLV